MLYWACLILVLAPLLLERVRLRRMRARIPVRIHVHGTRGKSGITRDIAARLRGRGLRVLAKTTGDAAEYVLPDGSVEPVRRRGPARVQEHVALLRKASILGADAVVAEGMALQPETVAVSERMLRATQAVIANTRPDHAETMGPGREGVLRTLRHMIPARGELFTADEAGAGAVRDLAARNGAPCVVVEAAPTAQGPALAEAVARAALGDAYPSRPSSSRSAAIAAPTTAVFRLGLPLSAHDLLSANDVVSSQYLAAACPPRPEFLTAALLTTRADRPLRSQAFLDWLLYDERFDLVAAMGDHAGYAWLRALAGRRPHRLLRVRPWLAPERLVRVLCAAALARDKSGLTVLAMGNVHGYGQRWRKAMELEAGHAH